MRRGVGGGEGSSVWGWELRVENSSNAEVKEKLLRIGGVLHSHGTFP